MISLTGVRINKNVFQCSLNGLYLAYAFGNHLIVESIHGGIIFQNICVGFIDFIEWSVDNVYILCGILHKQTIQIFSILDDNWRCKLKELPILGLQSACWSPSGLHVITHANDNVKLTIWSLMAGHSISLIDKPILKKDDKLSFNENGLYVAILCGDYDEYELHIRSTVTWYLENKVECSNSILSPSQPLWCPNNYNLVIWDTLDVNKCLVEMYSSQDNRLIHSFAKKGSLCGVCNVLWTPNGQFLLVACLNGSINVLNYITFTVIATLEHSNLVNTQCTPVYQLKSELEFQGIFERPVTLIGDRSSSLGVSKLVISTDGLSAATVADSMPAVIWIWHLETFELNTIIILDNKVTDLAWCKNMLAILFGSNRFVVWNNLEPKIIQIADKSHSRQLNLIKGCWIPCNNDSNMIVTTDKLLYRIQNLM